MNINKKKQSNFRWIILGLLFIATTILYIDRSAIGILAPDLQKSLGWSEEQYGMINTVFMIAYAICFIIMGRLIDTIAGSGYLIALLIVHLLVPKIKTINI
jgi:MFS transporter, ACS family, hexuronate transporter